MIDDLTHLTSSSKTHHETSFLHSFSRSQIASGAGSLVDYGSLFFMTEVLHIWYVAAVAIGAFLGAIINFTLNRYWSFRAHHHGHWTSQAKRYFVVSAGSLILNTLGVYIVTEFAHLHYAGSVAVISLWVGFFYNYPMHRYFVYRPQPKRGNDGANQTKNGNTGT